MTIRSHLYDAMSAKAEQVRVAKISIGLGYTAVSTTDGGIGLAYTMLDGKQGCCVVAADVDFEGRPALNLLKQIHSGHPVHRCMALALINALNHASALSLPEDRSNQMLMDLLAIGQGTHVAMVGHFPPLMLKLKQRGAVVEVVDEGKGIGDANRFQDRIGHWADALILTATAILNNSADALLEAGGGRVPTAVLGPSTPLVPEAFGHHAVRVLAGCAPLDSEAAFKAVRQGKGTPALLKFARKSYVAIPVTPQ